MNPATPVTSQRLGEDRNVCCMASSNFFTWLTSLLAKGSALVHPTDTMDEQLPITQTGRPRFPVDEPSGR